MLDPTPHAAVAPAWFTQSVFPLETQDRVVTMAHTHGRWARRLACCVAVTVVVCAIGSVAAGQDSIAAARDLYTAAAYEDALALLNRLRAGAHQPDDSRYIEQYRAFCLLALGRTTEAEHAIEAVVTSAPTYRPSDAEASPRVRTAFRDVRHRVLPSIIEQKYLEAKAAYDRKDHANARRRFRQVLDLLADPDIAAESKTPPLSELKTLATGFEDLCARALAPAPRPAPPPPQIPTAPIMPQPPRIYGLEDLDVVPPIVVRQSVAALADVFALRPGVLEIIIDENGDVEAATMRMSVNPVYDRLVLATAKTWKYRPATRDGVPVKFRKIVMLDLKTIR